MLVADGVAPSRLAAVGYGEFQPIADNATPEGRARNRRVVLVVSRHLDVRRTYAGSRGQAAHAADPSGTLHAFTWDQRVLRSMPLILRQRRLVLFMLWLYLCGS